MNMAKNITLEEFKKIYAEWQDSKLSIREYCVLSGFDEGKFYYWKKKINSQPETQSSFVPISMSQSGGKIAISRNGFDQAKPYIEPNSADSSCEIVYPNGVTLRVNSVMNMTTLRSLILLCQ